MLIFINTTLYNCSFDYCILDQVVFILCPVFIVCVILCAVFRLIVMLFCDVCCLCVVSYCSTTATG
jgi:hypothetical protein